MLPNTISPSPIRDLHKASKLLTGDTQFIQKINTKITQWSLAQQKRIQKDMREFQSYISELEVWKAQKRAEMGIL